MTRDPDRKGVESRYRPSPCQGLTVLSPSDGRAARSKPFPALVILSRTWLTKPVPLILAVMNRSPYERRRTRREGRIRATRAADVRTFYQVHRSDPG